MRKLFVLAALAVPLVLGLSAGPVGAANKPPVKLSGKVNNHGNKGADSKIDVEQDDYYFKPTFIKAKSGTTVEVELENEGNNLHNFSIKSLKINVNVKTGKKKTVSVDVPSDGTALNFYCKFHKTLGMQGAIYPKAGATVSNSNVSTGGSSSGGYGY